MARPTSRALSALLALTCGVSIVALTTSVLAQPANPDAPKAEPDEAPEANEAPKELSDKLSEELTLSDDEPEDPPFRLGASKPEREAPAKEPPPREEAPRDAAPRDAGPPRPDETGLGKHQKHIQLSLGARSMAISSDGYDLFSDTRALDQASLGGSHALFFSGPWSVAGALGVDLGGSSARVRGQEAALATARFSLGPEVRYHLLPRLYFHGRIAATLTRTSFELTDGAAGAILSDANYRGGFDVMLGGAFEVLGSESGADRKPRGWVVAELGYGWAGAHSVSLAPEGDEESNAPARVAPLDLPDVALRGVTAKLAVAISF
ncbi:MAG: hypothetical protein KIT72_07395 [Polyangiaceae bacterium]|nr:hypothetical protein [Polyangiaceae bacterium]MCW5790228.1 hypothetical protein [Polyangiaceae bacterium]